MPSGVIAPSSLPVRLLRIGRNSAPASSVAVPGRLEIFVNERVGAGMQRQIARLAAFAGHLEMRHAFARVPEVPDLELAQLVAPQRVKQQRREDGAVALGS